MENCQQWPPQRTDWTGGWGRTVTDEQEMAIISGKPEIQDRLQIIQLQWDIQYIMNEWNPTYVLYSKARQIRSWDKCNFIRMAHSKDTVFNWIVFSDSWQNGKCK